MKKVYLIIVFLFSSIIAFGQGTMEEAKRCLNQKEYDKAVRIFQALADKGEVEAKFYLALCYDKGQGVPQNHSKAAHWYQKAADQGFAFAQYNLALCYDKGQGVPQDHSKAAYWYQKAADQGFAFAQYILALCYDKGQGVPQDHSKAAHWYQKAADQNLPGAQLNLALCYDKGHGVPQDYSKAVYWYEKAAAQNYDLAKKNLDKLKLTSPQSTNNQVAQNETPTYTQPTNNNLYQPQDVEKIATCVLDKDIPITNKTANNTFAFIVGNENYLDAIKVPFANNDANIFAEYCKSTLGLPKENVKVYKDATFGVLVNAVSTIKKIAKAYEGKLNIIFYYSGHGIPDEASHEAFMLPIDADGQNMGICYSLDKLYKELKDTHAQKVLVLLDACFSGAVRGNGMIVEAKGVAIKPKKNVVDGNIVVLSAATDKQTAYPFEQEGHGLFTYYLLKKLHDTCGNVTLGELQSYIKSEVGKKAIVIKGKEQTPTVVTSGTMLNTWKSLPLR